MVRKLTPAASGGPADAPADDGTSRRQFLTGAGAAAGAAMIVAAPKVTSVLDTSRGGGATEPKPVAIKPSGTPPREPVTAYVRNEARGEVTVMSGTRETTYRAPALVKQLLDVAK